MARRAGLELFVSRLSFYSTVEDLRKLFSPFGPITEARLVIDPVNRRPKGFGFVKFESEIDAQNALKAINGRIVKGRLLFVEVAKERSEKNSSSS